MPPRSRAIGAALRTTVPAPLRKPAEPGETERMQETLVDIRAAELETREDLARYGDLLFARDYWDRIRGDAFAPPRASIDPADIVTVLPRVMLVDVSTDGPDGGLSFRYRLCGTGICDTHKYDLTHRTPNDLLPPAYGRLIESHYRDAIARRAPIAHVIALQTDSKSRSYARLILPLSGDGETVTMLMLVDSEKQNALQEFLEVIEALGDRT